MRAAFDRSPTPALAARLHLMQTTAGQAAEADRLAAEWLKSNPRDAEFISHLGSVALQRGDFAAAEAQYRRAVALRPEDALALNNLAWSLVQQKKPEALEHARKANQLVANQPQMMNTLATALRAAGNNAEAIEWQRKSVTASNGEPRYRLQLAEMLVTSGDKAGAREQLQALEALGDNFPQRDRVQELLKTVR